MYDVALSWYCPWPQVPGPIVGTAGNSEAIASIIKIVTKITFEILFNSLFSAVTESYTYAEAEQECKARYNGYLTDIVDYEQSDLLATDLERVRWSTFSFWTGLKTIRGKYEYYHPLMPGVTQNPRWKGGFNNPWVDGKGCTIAKLVSGRLTTFDVMCTYQVNAYFCSDRQLPTTPKPTTTTTTQKPPPPIIADPKKWIIDDKLGTQIHRSFHKGWRSHHYTTDWQTTPSSFEREGGPGYVVSGARYPQIKATCPNLIQVGIWRSGTISYIGNYPPAGFERKESFYCANRQFDCGANHLLRRLDKHSGNDIFYASDENEAHMTLLGYGTKEYVTNWFPETPCWVWKNQEDTWYTIVRANGGMIWGAYHFNALVHFYTLQRHLIPGAFKKTAGPGYIVNQDVYDSYFKSECPELVTARIWHGVNSKSEHITWIGRENRSPPANGKNWKAEDLRFYCAPRANYCNANFLLRRMDKTDGSSFFYPQTEKEAWEQLAGAPPGIFKNTRWSEEVCYIWQRW